MDQPPSTKRSAAAAVVNPSSGDINLYSGTLPGQEIALRAISIDSTAIFIAVVDSHDEERVVSLRLRALLVAMWFVSLPWCDLYVIMSFVI